MISVQVKVTYSGPRTPEINQAVGRGLLAAANLHRNESVRLILQGPKSGHKYGRHQASAPGEPPASDTGRLANSISVRHEAGSLTASVVCSASYGLALEIGTPHIRPRPFLRPPLASKRGEIIAAINKPVAKLFGA